MGGGFKPHGTMKSLREGVSGQELETLLTLHSALFTDISRFVEIDLSRDIQTLTRRTRHEGFAFLSVTLPSLGKAILAGLEGGILQVPTAFHRQSGRSIPVFLSGLIENLFDAHTGQVKDDSCYVCVWAIQQICFFVYKYEVPISASKERIALTSMMETDENNPVSFPLEAFPLNEKKGKLLFVASNLADDLFAKLDLQDIVPRHGPGGVSEGGLMPHEKYQFREWDSNLESLYPNSAFTYASPADCRRQLHLRGATLPVRTRIPCARAIIRQRNYASRGSCVIKGLYRKRDKTPERITRISKTCTVPKDSRAPRVISEEDKELMYLQLGQKSALYEYLESHRWTKGFVNFTDQSINANLALIGSKTTKLATLDMKDASDRVSLALVHALLPSHIFGPLYATRSHTTYIHYQDDPVGYFHKLRKFAPMGSGVCFPVEAVIFWLLAVSAIMVLADERFSVARRSVHVYGDDIIVPKRYAYLVMEALEWYGLKFNRSKCFIEGSFRESCGTDAYRGVVVTPVKLKKRIPCDTTDAESLVSWSKLANELSKRGLTLVAENMFSVVESILGKLPMGNPSSGYICRWGDPGVDSLPAYHQRTKLLARGPRGPGQFLWIELPKNEYQCHYVTAWVLVTKSYRPDDFSESARYLRAVTSHPEASEWFTLRHNVRLVRRRVLLS